MGEISERYQEFFRLRSLTILNHRVLGNIHLNFCQGEPYLGVYTTVIIGANGIGKSFILRVISEIFCCLERLKQEKDQNIPQYYFEIEYMSERQEFKFANFRDINAVERQPKRYSHFVYYKNNQEVTVWQMVLPKRVIASSTTLSDKYVARSTDMYRYKGLRNENSPSSTGTRTMVRKTVEGLLGSLDAKYGFREELKELLKHLGLLPQLELTYNLSYKHVFVKEDMTRSKLDYIFENQKTYFGTRESELWGTRNYNKMREEESWKLDYMVEFFQRLALRGFNDGKKLLKYDLLDEESYVSEDREALKALAQLNLLSYPSLKVHKANDNYEFDQSSSGESSLFCQLVSIMSDIEPNSLVLIDEPEASSHPNWQISYMGWLKQIFNRYFNCHFVISTHSHFMLTDIEPQTSDIVALEKKEGVITDVSDGINTYNWSVDDILYRVFGVRNTRNRAFESDIMTLYNMMSNASDDLLGIEKLVNKLSSFELPGNDPLIEILNQARKYVEAKKNI